MEIDWDKIEKELKEIADSRWFITSDQVKFLDMAFDNSKKRALSQQEATDAFNKTFKTKIWRNTLIRQYRNAKKT